MVGIDLKDKQTLVVSEGKTTRPPGRGRPADNLIQQNITGSLHRDYIARNCMLLRWLTPRYPEKCCLCSGVSQHYSLMKPVL